MCQKLGGLHRYVCDKIKLCARIKRIDLLCARCAKLVQLSASFLPYLQPRDTSVTLSVFGQNYIKSFKPSMIGRD